MTDPGLNHRLRQRSRRAGIMIGISMALTIAVCVGSFSVIYASLDDFFGDFVARGETIPPPPTHAAEPTAAAQAAAQAKPTEAAKPTVAPTPKPTVATTPTPASDAFKPDYQLNSSGSVNFRSGPGREFEPVGVITPEQPLQYLDEDAPTENPAEDGDRWMKFRTEDGEEGWIREIDVSEYVP